MAMLYRWGISRNIKTKIIYFPLHVCVRLVIFGMILKLRIVFDFIKPKTPKLLKCIIGNLSTRVKIESRKFMDFKLRRLWERNLQKFTSGSDSEISETCHRRFECICILMKTSWEVLMESAWLYREDDFCHETWLSAGDLHKPNRRNFHASHYRVYHETLDYPFSVECASDF